MYAIIETGGKQFRVEEGASINVARLDAEAGSEVNLDKVLMVGDGEAAKFGAPYVDGASVSAKLLENKRGKKVVIIKKKRRKGYQRKRGHRQELSVIKIESIKA